MILRNLAYGGGSQVKMYLILIGTLESPIILMKMPFNFIQVVTGMICPLMQDYHS